MDGLPPPGTFGERVRDEDPDDAVASVEPFIRAAIHALYDPILNEPLSERLQAVVREIRAGLPAPLKSAGRRSGD